MKRPPRQPGRRNNIWLSQIFNNKVFSFCNWNCNSITKNNFNRVDLLKVQASIYNYDILSLCETLLNDTVEIPEPLLEG